MPYFEIQDFRAGLDTRRMAVKGAAGSLLVASNAHLNRGAEIEKRKAFAPQFTLPAGTLGLVGVGDRLHVFGPGANPGVPPQVTYTQLTPPPGFNMARIASAQVFGGFIYVVVEFTNGESRHYYNGALVTALSISSTVQNGRVTLPHKNKMYVASGNLLFSSKVAEANNFNSGEPGVGFFDMTSQALGAETLRGLADYQQQMAVFSRRAVQVWSFAADPAQAVRQQTLLRIGTVASRSIVSVGGADVFFLADSGVRSLRVRDVAGNVNVDDVGTPIDDLLTDAMRGLTDAQLEQAFAELEPDTGRYWLTLNGRTYVYSYFPGARVAAWTTYDLPSGADAIAVAGNRVYVRAGDDVFLYGGVSGQEYDATVAEVETPYIDGRAIATWKRWRGLDVACEGTWDIFASYDPQRPTIEDQISTVSGSTHYQLDDAIAAESPMVKLRLRSRGAGPAKLSSIAMHYDVLASR